MVFATHSWMVFRRKKMYIQRKERMTAKREAKQKQTVAHEKDGVSVPLLAIFLQV